MARRLLLLADMREHTTLRSVTNDDLSHVLGGCGKKMQCPQPPPQQMAPPPPQPPPPAADGGLDVSVKVAHGAGAASAMRGDQGASQG